MEFYVSKNKIILFFISFNSEKYRQLGPIEHTIKIMKRCRDRIQKVYLIYANSIPLDLHLFGGFRA